MRMERLPASEFERRVHAVQESLQKHRIDLLITYSSEGESASCRYLTDFWPFFDFASVLVPAEGSTALVTGGPESFDYAETVSRAEKIFINPLYVEVSAPQWVQGGEGENFKEIFSKVCTRTPKRIGITDWSIFPSQIMVQIREAAPDAQIIPADDILLGVRAVKSDIEIPYIEKAFSIAEEAMKAAVAAVTEGIAEYEIEAAARIRMLELGAEGVPYPPWVCSGENTVYSLCRSSERRIRPGDLVQCTIGSKYLGYCGNMCRAFSYGPIPDAARTLMEAVLESTEYALSTIKPGVRASDVFAGYYRILEKYGYEKFTLYGPAHGTGYYEVEGLWLSKEAQFIIQENMLFNIDIWLSDGTYGMRFEEGVIVTEKGVRELNPAFREVMSLEHRTR